MKDKKISIDLDIEDLLGLTEPKNHSLEYDLNFIINNGVVELQDNHWLYFKKEDNTNIEKLSIIEKVYYENDTYIVEERAGFIYNDSLSKYSEISNSIVRVDSNRESLEKYFKRNKKQFPLFKHTFKYNESTEDYYYYSTETN